MSNIEWKPTRRLTWQEVDEIEYLFMKCDRAVQRVAQRGRDAAHARRMRGASGYQNKMTALADSQDEDRLIALERVYGTRR